MERLWFIANLAEVLVDREDFSLVRMHCPPGDQPPLHVHAADDEGFYVLAGSLTLSAGERVIRLVPGQFALAPHGVPHTYRAGDQGAVVLVTSAPGGFVSFLRAAGVPALSANCPSLPRRTPRVCARSMPRSASRSSGFPGCSLRSWWPLRRSLGVRLPRSDCSGDAAVTADQTVAAAVPACLNQAAIRHQVQQPRHGSPTTFE